MAATQWEYVQLLLLCLLLGKYNYENSFVPFFPFLLPFSNIFYFISEVNRNEMTTKMAILDSDFPPTTLLFS